MAQCSLAYWLLPKRRRSFLGSRSYAICKALSTPTPLKCRRLRTVLSASGRGCCMRYRCLSGIRSFISSWKPGTPFRDLDFRLPQPSTQTLLGRIALVHVYYGRRAGLGGTVSGVRTPVQSNLVYVLGDPRLTDRSDTLASARHPSIISTRQEPSLRSGVLRVVYKIQSFYRTDITSYVGYV